MSMTFVTDCESEPTLICKTCGEKCHGTSNGECHKCHAITSAKWQKKMAIRQDPTQFDINKLVRCLLTEHWMHECEIIPAYMPPFPGKDTRPTCQVRYVYEDGSDTFLRYSKGPAQGFFWDMYGEDMMSPELALVCISKAPPPVRVGVVIPT